MTSFSEASEGDVTRETIMADSEIMAEESVEEPATAEASGKLSLRMKLVTPVEEGSSGSERFSLQSKRWVEGLFLPEPGNHIAN